MKNQRMNTLPTAAALLLASNLAQAVPMTWELLNNNMDVVGTFMLDSDTQTTSNASISGDLGYYTISSTFTFLNSSGFVGGYPVNNYFKFFSAEAGKVYTDDFGNGEYNQIRVNDSAIDIGTLGTLAPGGGLYDAYIHEIYNFDEISVYCSYYEELYDDEGNYIGQGGCGWYDSYANYNIESGYWYDGFYLRSAPVVGAVPIAPTGWLVLLGLAGLHLSRRQEVRSQRA
jgi:hypothetical protein